jgi:hypothetical protein
MEFFKNTEKKSDIGNVKENKDTVSEETMNKFDKIMGDDKIENTADKHFDDVVCKDGAEREEKLDKLFETGDLFKEREVDLTDDKQREKDETFVNINISENLVIKESNRKYEIDGDIYETDDNGDTYKKNGELLPNSEYTINGNTYKTDEHGNIISCYSEPSYTEDGTRNTKEQKESGGEDRQENDDGGHVIAKSLGGSEGEENLVPMRVTINRGDYKKMENEVRDALKEGKKVTMHIDIEYDGDSQRPSKISVEYTIDDKKTVVEYDNEENSTELLDSLNDVISDEDYDMLKEEINDMKEDGVEVSVTSVKTEYDENGNPTKITVGLLDESTGEKTYKVYGPKQEEL